NAAKSGKGLEKDEALQENTSVAQVSRDEHSETSTHREQQKNQGRTACNEMVKEQEDSTEKEHMCFSNVVKSVSSKENQSGVTVPFYFICLLHLANEKGLKLEGQGDMRDLTISSDSLMGRSLPY
ncbi:unnamed protein product, partial [Choristocarpus tenellus]